MAGVLGIDPDPRTVRELLLMHDARMRDNWDHTAWLAAHVANSNPYRRKPLSLEECNPLQSKGRSGGGARGIAINRNTIHILKALVPKERRRA